MREAIYQAFHLDEALFAELLEQADEATQKLQRLYPLSDDETLAMKSYDEAFLVSDEHGVVPAAGAAGPLAQRFAEAYAKLLESVR